MVCAFFCCCSLLSLSIIVVVYTFLVLIQQHHHTTYSHPSGISSRKKRNGKRLALPYTHIQLTPNFPSSSSFFCWYCSRSRRFFSFSLSQNNFPFSLHFSAVFISILLPFNQLLIQFFFLCSACSQCIFSLTNNVGAATSFFFGTKSFTNFYSLSSFVYEQRPQKVAFLVALPDTQAKYRKKKSYIVRALSASVEFSECAVFVRVPGEYGRKL